MEKIREAVTQDYWEQADTVEQMEIEIKQLSTALEEQRALLKEYRRDWAILWDDADGIEESELELICRRHDIEV